MQSSLRQKGQEAEDLQLCQPHFQPRPDYQQSLYKHLRDNRAISSQHSFVWSKSSQTDLIPFLASVTGPAEQLEPHSWTVARFGARSGTTRVLGDQDPGAGGGAAAGILALERREAPRRSGRHCVCTTCSQEQQVEEAGERRGMARPADPSCRHPGVNIILAKNRTLKYLL